MNSFLSRMGYGPGDRVLITHIDDVGCCHAANQAAFACLDAGAASCASVIVNAPWFPEAAAICRDNPQYDMGVHLTLTSEYDSYRWPALSSRDRSTGLLDDEGYLWRTMREAVKNVTEAAATAEMRAQLETALAAGIDVTHVDTHMGTVLHPKFMVSYLQLAAEFNLPAFLPKLSRERLAEVTDPDDIDDYVAFMDGISSDVPFLDEIIIDTLKPVADKVAYYKELIDGIEPGLTHLLFHAARMSDELRAMTPDSCEWRNQDFEAFADPALREHLYASDARLIGYRELRTQLQGSAPGG